MRLSDGGAEGLMISSLSPARPPGPGNMGTRQFVPPAPGQGRCELNTGGDISIGFALNLVWSRSLQRTQGVPPECLTCSQSHFWAEILSAAHHLSLDGASTSTPSYLMLARSSEDLRSHIWYNWADRHWHWAHIGCQLWEHRMVAWHRDDTGGTGGVASHQSRVTIIWKSNPISEPTRNIAASHWQTTHGNLSFSPTFGAAFLDMVLDLTGTQTHHLSFLFKRNNGLRCWSARILVLVCIII